MRWVGAGVVAALLVVACVGEARAQSIGPNIECSAPVDGDTTTLEARADEHFRRGSQLYTEGQYELAIPEFLAVYCLIPVPEAAFNIASSLIMLVKDKGRDIGILRTMGASQGSIMRVFLITGAAIGVIGDFVGFLVGLLVCLNIESIRQFMSWLTNTELFSPELYFLSRLPAQMDAGETAAVVVMALTLSLLATLFPSWRAARLDPVEALRYE